jgi:predicted metal-binding protein
MPPPSAPSTLLVCTRCRAAGADPDAPRAGAALLAATRAHAARADGFLPRAERPERLHAGILARLPPLHWIPAQPEEVIAWPA